MARQTISALIVTPRQTSRAKPGGDFTPCQLPAGPPVLVEQPGVTLGRLTERGNAALGGLERERHGEPGVVTQAGRDRVAGGLPRGQNRQAEDRAAIGD